MIQNLNLINYYIRGIFWVIYMILGVVGGGGALSLTFMLKCVGFAIKPKWNATLDITREWYIQSHIPLSILYYFLELLGGCFDFVYNLFTRK